MRRLLHLGIVDKVSILHVTFPPQPIVRVVFRVLEDRLRPDLRQIPDDAVPGHCKMLDDQCTFIEDGFGT